METYVTVGQKATFVNDLDIQKTEIFFLILQWRKNCFKGTGALIVPIVGSW